MNTEVRNLAAAALLVAFAGITTTDPPASLPPTAPPISGQVVTPHLPAPSGAYCGRNVVNQLAIGTDARVPSASAACQSGVKSSNLALTTPELRRSFSAMKACLMPGS